MANLHADATGTELHVDLRIKVPVRVASSSNVTLSAPGTTIDSVTMVSGDRFLAYGQTAGAENGIWVFNGSAVAASRATDADTSTDFVSLFQVGVSEGTSAGKYFTYTTAGAISLGITNLTFTGNVGSGTVTNVALSMTGGYTVSGSPITSSGTLTVTENTQSANTVKAGPTTGGATTPSYRALVNADLPSAPTVTGEITASDFKPSGLTGATTATRYVGGTASVAPTTGTFSTGDYVVTQSGAIFVCTSSGSPGTWVQTGGSDASKLNRVGGTADHPLISDYVDLTDQGSNPSSPSSGVHRFFAKAGGLYVKDNGGTVVGALGAGGGGGSLIWQEVDGTPSGTPTTIKFPNGSLTDNGDGSFTYTAPGTALTVAEADGSPSSQYGTLKFPNNTLTDNLDGSVTYTPPGSSGGGVGDALYLSRTCI